MAAAEKVIEAMDLSRADVDADGCACASCDGDGNTSLIVGSFCFRRHRVDVLDPTATFNPVMHWFYQWLAARALTPACPIPPPDACVQQ